MLLPTTAWPTLPTTAPTGPPAAAPTAAPPTIPVNAPLSLASAPCADTKRAAAVETARIPGGMEASIVRVHGSTWRTPPGFRHAIVDKGALLAEALDYRTVPSRPVKGESGSDGTCA